MPNHDDHPTLYEWAGGKPAFDRLTKAFYGNVLRDDLLRRLFEGMEPAHPRYVATLLAEVFWRPREYTEIRGGYPHMLAKHRNLAITQAQRVRWVQLISEAADEADRGPGVPVGVHGLREWGTRLALANSRPVPRGVLPCLGGDGVRRRRSRPLRRPVGGRRNDRRVRPVPSAGRAER